MSQMVFSGAENFICAFALAASFIVIVAHDDNSSDFLEGRDSSTSQQHIPTGIVASSVPSDISDDMLCD